VTLRSSLHRREATVLRSRRGAETPGKGSSCQTAVRLLDRDPPQQAWPRWCQRRPNFRCRRQLVAEQENEWAA
jgi:hypothetical protein